ncbi:MAG TPA: hypothetical protein VLR94_00390 [Acidobacteriota bacterium]|nr:hypothetical protein [Acidobacteriota bacterium]
MEHPEFRIPKISVPIVCHTIQEEEVRGDIFLDMILTEGYSVQQIIDYFNATAPFFPIRTSGRQPVLISKASVVLVDVPQLTDQYREDTSSFSVRTEAVVHVHSLGPLRLTIIVDLPEEHSRLLDLVNVARKAFFPAMLNNSLSLVSLHHIYKIEEA